MGLVIVADKLPAKSNLAYVSDEGELKGLLQFSTTMLDPAAKFALEPSHNYPGCVHLRCNSNNLYWVRSAKEENWIAAKATDAVDDVKVWNSTLFEPSFTNAQGAPVLQLAHKQSRRLVRYDLDAYCLTLDPNNSSVAYSTVVDYANAAILPKYVSFKGDNDNYLSPANGQILQFGESDSGAELNVTQLYLTESGYYRMKNYKLGTYWRRGSDNLIRADSSDAKGTDPNTWFSIVKTGGKNLAIRSVSGGSLCKRLESNANSLSATSNSIIKEARLTLEEPVFMRAVNVTTFHTDRARIYGETPIVVQTQTGFNTTDTSQSMTMEFKFTDKTSKTWTTSTTMTAEASFSFSSNIPLIEKTEISFAARVDRQYIWGQTVEEARESMASYTAVVPPKTKVTVKLIATQGMCDIPFTYSQSDTLVTGKSIYRKVSDGVYTGINSYSFDFKTQSEPITEETPQ